MENQINNCLISLRKIANLNEQSRIDTLKGDIDEYSETIIHHINRSLFDSRDKALKLLIEKYRNVKEITNFIMESGKFIDRLPVIRAALEKSKEGLTLYKSNLLYIDDKKIKSTIEHLLMDEIPSQISSIDSLNQQ